MPASKTATIGRGMGDVNPTLKYAIRALQHRKVHKTLSKNGGKHGLSSRDADARHFIIDLVKDRVVAMGASRVTETVVRSHLAHSLSGSSIQSLLRQMYDNPFGRGVIHHISGAAIVPHGDGGGGAAAATAAVGAAYEKIGTNAIAMVVTMLLRCGWDLMEVLMGKKQWRDFWRSFVVAVGATAGGIVGWTAGAGVGGSIVAALPCIGPGLAGNIGAVCAFLGTMLGDYVASTATTRFVEWFMGDKKRGRGGNVLAVDGRKRERSGEGRSSREDGPRRPLPRRNSGRPPMVQRGSWTRPRPRDTAGPYHGGRPGRRGSVGVGDGDEPRKYDSARTPPPPPRRRPSKARHDDDDESDSSDSDSDSDSEDEVTSDSTYDTTPPRHRINNARPRLQRPNSYIRTRCDSYMNNSNKKNHDYYDNSSPKGEPLLLKEHGSPVQNEVEIRRRVVGTNGERRFGRRTLAG